MIPVPTLRDWLGEGPFSLTLSSGFFAFFAHAGLLQGLEEAGLMPSRLSGSSAGALVGGAWASGVNAVTIRDAFFRLQRDDFWDPRPGLGLLRGNLFRASLESLLAARTFETCRATFAASVFDVLGRRTRALDHGDLAAAIHASCAVPLMFHPVWIDRRPYYDGGILDRHGLAGMPKGRLLYHHIASRSPWRQAQSAALQIPKRERMIALSIEGLPRVGPFHLERGTTAFRQSLDATRRALDRPVAAVLRL